MRVPLRVLVVDDQTLVREGLAVLVGALPGVTVVGTAADGAEAVAAVDRLRPDVVLMDLRMPVMDGITATRQLQRRDPIVPVVVLTTYADDASVAHALRAGARGYLTKDAAPADIAAALEIVRSGGAAVAPALQRRAWRAAGGAPGAWRTTGAGLAA